MDGKELILALELVGKEKGIDKEVIFEAIENSLVTACKKLYGNYSNMRVEIDRETGEMRAFAQREVVEEVVDDFTDISLEEARALNPTYELGDFVDNDITPKDFGRSASQSAKQIVVQKLREAEREKTYNEFAAKERECDTGIVERTDSRGNVIVKLGKMDAVLQQTEQIPGEVYHVNDRIKVYILKVVKTSKDPQIKVSRTHYELIKRLFELESPEVFDGTVQIKGIAREAGSRAKMAVYSNVEGVDAVGACVGQNGIRVDAIVSELNGEKIDVIPWSEDPAEFINAALRPAKVMAVEINEDDEERSAKVVVPDMQLSLAIGKEGQNVRLAAKLTGWKIDIKSESQARATSFIDFGDEGTENTQEEKTEESSEEEASQSENVKDDIYLNEDTEKEAVSEENEYNENTEE
ncbi:MAG: transcription termination factor NusA [Clostridia bacterium]|nr:transcription termination factor NusA [Clostridia bacterium]